MHNKDLNKPIVMCFSGLDPSGGAGIQADIETCASLGCHTTPIITSLTIQDSSNVYSVEPTNPELLTKQARAVLDDMPINVFKLGLLASTEVIEAVHTLLLEYAHIPVILDPILSAGGGKRLTTLEMLSALETLILPRTTLITPNASEAMRIADQADSIDACANEIMAKGPEYVLITDAAPEEAEITNRLWGHGRTLNQQSWARCEGAYHGTGCTISAAISAYTAHGTDIPSAVRQAQAFTWNAVSHGQQLGNGQANPDRLFWSKPDTNSQWNQAN